MPENTPQTAISGAPHRRTLIAAGGALALAPALSTASLNPRVPSPAGYSLEELLAAFAATGADQRSARRVLGDLHARGAATQAYIVGRETPVPGLAGVYGHGRLHARDAAPQEVFWRAEGPRVGSAAVLVLCHGVCDAPKLFRTWRRPGEAAAIGRLAVSALTAAELELTQIRSGAGKSALHAPHLLTFSARRVVAAG